MMGCPVPEGALFYGETKRRVAVPFNATLRRLTEETIGQLRDVFISQRTPPAIYKAKRCRACSLIELCRPKAIAKPAGRWRDRMLEAILAEDAQ